jgi:hypothetical protein
MTCEDTVAIAYAVTGTHEGKIMGIRPAAGL